MRHETIKLLEENIGSKFPNMGLVTIFFNLTPKAKVKKQNINKWDYIKILLQRKRNNQ